jgi:hypothetical protein
MRLSTSVKFSLAIYFLCFLFYSIFSFSLTDPNLVLITWPPYWQFQQWMWQTFFLNAPLLSITYVVLISCLVTSYLFILWQFFHLPENFWKNVNQHKLSALLCYLLLISPLLLSYNALSHDVFNYIFNAKMVLVYHVNPHQQVALSFPSDNLLRFMHNTHTPAPYGYGWTLISLLPYILGLGKFSLTWMMFRMYSLTSILLLAGATWYTLQRLFPKRRDQFLGPAVAVVFLNPLFLIEVISNFHNDLWMMASAIFALGLVASPSRERSRFFKILLSGLFLAFSISTKLATVLLVPIWAYLIFANQPLFTHLKLRLKNWPLWALMLLFLPLLTDRSQQFLPWYLTWLLVWLPFVPSKTVRTGVIILSISSLFRYLPWLWNGQFSDLIILQQKMITWVPFIIWIAFKSVEYLVHSSRKASASA